MTALFIMIAYLVRESKKMIDPHEFLQVFRKNRYFLQKLPVLYQNLLKSLKRLFIVPKVLPFFMRRHIALSHAVRAKA